MKKLSRKEINKLIVKELKSIVDEEKLLKFDDLEPDQRRKFSQHQKYTYEKSDCYECGGKMYEGECMECGYSGDKVLKENTCDCKNCESCLEDDLYGQNALSMSVDFTNHGGIQHHRHNNYMAKPSLYKVAKYAQKLLHMIPDGYELDDWQRTKIAQISDDISEVYHSLDYDFRE